LTGLIIDSTCFTTELERLVGLGYLLKIFGVTLLTVLSRVCAERIVATNNSKALLWIKGVSTVGYSFFNCSRIFLGFEFILIGSYYKKT
jgi:hypothetical protein